MLNRHGADGEVRMCIRKGLHDVLELECCHPLDFLGISSLVRSAEIAQLYCSRTKTTSTPCRPSMRHASEHCRTSCRRLARSDQRSSDTGVYMNICYLGAIELVFAKSGTRKAFNLKSPTLKDYSEAEALHQGLGNG